jgi:hypothetical protein
MNTSTPQYNYPYHQMLVYKMMNTRKPDKVFIDLEQSLRLFVARTSSRADCGRLFISPVGNMMGTTPNIRPSLKSTRASSDHRTPRRAIACCG